MTKFITAFLVLMLAACDEDTTVNNSYYTTPSARIVYGGSDRPAALASVSGYALQGIERIGINVIELPEEQADEVLDRLRADPDVTFAEIDQLIQPDFVPNDEFYSRQYFLPLVGAEQAWDIGNGTDTVVAVLDTGVYGAHPELVGKVLPGFNSVDLSSNTTDEVGHGTSVAGMVTAYTNNGSQIAALAFGAQILPVRVSNDALGYAYFSDIARGLTWAADNGANVANISYKAHVSYAIAEAARYGKTKGMLTFSSAGNNGYCDTSPDQPQMVIVSATTASDAMASWSSCGQYVDIAAPGAQVLTLNKSGGMSTVSGTSFSSPLSAAAASVMMSVNPALSPDEVADILRATAIDLGAAGYDIYYGHGRLNAAAAVQLAADMRSDYEPPPAPEPGPEPEPEPEPDPDPVLAVKMMYPLDGSYASGRLNVGIVAEGNNPVLVFQCFVDGVLASSRTWKRDQRGNVRDCPIVTKRYSNGEYTVEGRAVDVEGNEASQSVRVWFVN